MGEASPVSAPSPTSKIKLGLHASITALVVVGPLLAVALGIWLLWGRAVHVRDLLLAVGLFLLTGHGVTVGFHRLFTHRSFTASRPLKIVLAVAGSMAVEGSVTSWVANHRRHHVFSDRAGDPHSPQLRRGERFGRWRGLLHAHVGWLFVGDDTTVERYAPDMARDPDVRVISKLFPVLALASFALPFGLGWLLSGRTIVGALTALLWGGLVRMTVLHHITWSVNSVCHMFGRKPFAADDESRNFAPLAVIAMGESWHNFHHACPSSARHGVLRGQLDSSAAVIKVLERAGWASKVRWPSVEQIAQARVRTA